MVPMLGFIFATSKKRGRRIVRNETTPRFHPVDNLERKMVKLKASSHDDAVPVFDSRNSMPILYQNHFHHISADVKRLQALAGKPNHRKA